MIEALFIDKHKITFWKKFYTEEHFQEYVRENYDLNIMDVERY